MSKQQPKIKSPYPPIVGTILIDKHTGSVDLTWSEPVPHELITQTLASLIVSIMQEKMQQIIEKNRTNPFGNPDAKTEGGANAAQDGQTK